jgi:predicted NAD/FAD-dependent oxidoreductase
MSRVVIVGAGVSGLACAQALKAAGQSVLVLERARGVGGRCATRRVEDVQLDSGPAFLHGRDAEFLAALAEVPATRVPGWPAVVEGRGQPCQPDAFLIGEQRLAFAEGVNAFPRFLATGLDVRLEQNVARLEPAGDSVLVETAAGEEHQAPVVVLALAAEQSRALLQSMAAPSPEVRGAAALLGLSRSQACLSLLAVYPQGTPPPAWEVCYPQDSTVLQLMSHDSSKRKGAGAVALVLQARAAWSRAHLEDAAWPELLLAEAARLLGPWAGTPRARHAHRWTWARNDRSAELAAPMLFALPGGGRLGLCGDRFAPGGGVEAAWRSGRALAARIISQSKGQS